MCPESKQHGMYFLWGSSACHQDGEQVHDRVHAGCLGCSCPCSNHSSASANSRRTWTAGRSMRLRRALTSPKHSTGTSAAPCSAATRTNPAAKHPA